VAHALWDRFDSTLRIASEQINMYLPILMNKRIEIQPAVPSFSLDTAGIVALADLATIQERTALTGTAALLDCLVLCPGLHLQQRAVTLNNGEHPACGAMTTGYVFRVENPATVLYLQKVSWTAHLTNIKVSKLHDSEHWHTRLLSLFFSFHTATPISTIAYMAAVFWAIAVIVLMGLAHDWWGLGVIGILFSARLCNFIIIRRRSRCGWFGASEPGVEGDLLILLTQDRWVRMKGKVDDLKAVTAGQWLQDEAILEGWVGAFATIIVYFDAALATNIQQFGKILLLLLLIGSAGLLAVANLATQKSQMHGRLLEVDGDRKKYERRIEMASEMIKLHGRDDFAKQMGLIPSDKNVTM
jgi:hypothetical protein